MSGPEPVETVLRSALRDRADQVSVAPDALQRIRGRTGRRRQTWTISLAGLATAATAVVIVVLLTIGDRPPPGPPAPPVRPAATPVVRVPVYFAGALAGDGAGALAGDGADDAVGGGSGRLFREFHPASSAGSLPDRIRAAVQIMLSGPPFDPDYRSAWPTTVSVRDVHLEAGPSGPDIGVVDLGGAMPTGITGAIALQQLVYTVTAVAADQGEQLRGVLVRHDGVDWSDAPLTRGPAVETLAPVWLISPQEGDRVGTAVDVHVAATLSSPVRLVVRDATGRTVFDQPVPVTAPVTPAPNGAVASNGSAVSRGEAYLSLTLAPGVYTLDAYDAAAPPTHDTHKITVTP